MGKASAPLRAATVGLIAGCAATLAACGTSSPSTLNAKGPGAHTIAGLWWFMFGVSAAVVVFIVLLLLVGLRPRHGRGGEEDAPSARWPARLIVGGGVVFPVIILSVLWVLTLRDMAALSDPPSTSTLRVDVVGHQWWWEVRYPDQGIVTANDVHIPVGVAIHLVLTTDDVLHSFWVPQLTAKTDLIAGRVNHMTLLASTAGVYRGQCAEFCGLQHANMAFYVIAQSRPEFAEWTAHEQATPPSLVDPTVAAGREVFVNGPCAACHTIKGLTSPPAPGSTPGAGLPGPLTAVRGPDLTDFGGRIGIGAGTVPNNAGNLAEWIADSRAIKPGNVMPPMPLTPGDLQAVVAFLESLK